MIVILERLKEERIRRGSFFQNEFGNGLKISKIKNKIQCFYVFFFFFTNVYPFGILRSPLQFFPMTL